MIQYLPNKYNFGDNDLERVNINGKRHYMVNGNPLPSVTTVLNFEPKPEVEKWRKRVGEAEANRISHAATYRGNEMHNMIESYIKTGDAQMQKYMPKNVEMYMWIKEKIDNHITEVYACETYLYSESLAVAGAVDNISLWDGVPSVVDWKSSTRKKKEQWIDGYFKQESVYAYMAFERSQANGPALFCPQIVTVVATEETREAEVFIQRTKPWLDEAMITIQKYQEFIVENS